MIKRSEKIANNKWRLLNTKRNLKRWSYFLTLRYGETLEVGPGVGLFTVMLRQQGVENITLLEKNHNCVQTASDMLKINEVDGVLMVEGDITDAPFIGHCFDTIVCLEVLEHLTNPYKALREMARVCRKGGYLYVSVPGKGVLPPSKCAAHHQDFDHEDLYALIEDTGWSVYKRFTDDHYQYFYSQRTR